MPARIRVDRTASAGRPFWPARCWSRLPWLPCFASCRDAFRRQPPTTSALPSTGSVGASLFRSGCLDLGLPLALLTHGRRPSIGEAHVAPGAGRRRSRYPARTEPSSCERAGGGDDDRHRSRERRWPRSCCGGGVFLHEFPDDAHPRGSVAALPDSRSGTSRHRSCCPPGWDVGDSCWEPAVVGAASAASAWRSKGLRNCLLPHIATDACGVSSRPLSSWDGSCCEHLTEAA